MDSRETKRTVPVPSVGADGEQPISQATAMSISEAATENNPQEKSLEERLLEMRRMTDPAYLPTISMSELYQNVYQGRPPIIDGLLYPGTYLFAGAPKVGKSFLMAQLAYHVSMGLPLWGYPVHKGTVLYLALEDDHRRLQGRLYRMFGMDGTNGRSDGFMMRSRFDIAVSSEVMAILAIAKDLKDLRQRMGKIIVAYDRDGKPVTTADLEVDGAMTAWMVEAINPNLIQTIEGQPVFVHAGPFANIAIGQSSVIADRIGLKLNEYHVTESGFGADIGYEKFWNLKCHYSGLTPDAAVVVATVRALKSHGGAPVPVPGRPLPEEYRTENVGFVEAGCCNLLHHIKTVKRSGVSPVVCINAFVTDTKAEIAKVRELCEAAGARVALSTHWEHGGEGALELADAVMDACNDKTEFKPLYSWDMPFKERIELVAREVYGADGVDFSAEASRKLADIQKRDDANELGLCMVKTHLSLSDDPGVKGAPKGWKLRIRDVLTFGGAGFVVPVSGSITLMPGTGSNPSFRRVDVDVDTGRVKGIF